VAEDISVAEDMSVVDTLEDKRSYDNTNPPISASSSNDNIIPQTEETHNLNQLAQATTNNTPTQTQNIQYVTLSNGDTNPATSQLYPSLHEQPSPVSQNPENPLHVVDSTPLTELTSTNQLAIDPAPMNTTSDTPDTTLTNSAHVDYKPTNTVPSDFMPTDSAPADPTPTDPAPAPADPTPTPPDTTHTPANPVPVPADPIPTPANLPSDLSVPIQPTETITDLPNTTPLIIQTDTTPKTLPLQPTPLITSISHTSTTSNPFLDSYQSTTTTTSTSYDTIGDAPASLDWWDSEFVHIRPQQIKSTSTSTTSSSITPFSDIPTTPFLADNNINYNNNNNNSNLNYSIANYYNKITNNNSNTTFTSYNNSYSTYSLDNKNPVTYSPSHKPVYTNSLATSNDHLIREFENDLSTASATYTTSTSTSTTSTTTSTTSPLQHDGEFFSTEKREPATDIDPIEESVIDEVCE
jgi:hypothetical protein